MDLAQEVGYLKGMQEATQRELGNINATVSELKTDVEDLKRTTATKEDLEVLRAEISETFSTKLDDAVMRLQGGSGPQSVQSGQTILQSILKSQLTPMIIVVLAMFGTLAVVFSRETGKPASSFVPFPTTTTVPPGGSATSTTTVTAPPP